MQLKLIHNWSEHYDTFGQTRGVFSKVILGFRNFGYDFLGVRGDVEGDSADMRARKFPLTSMGGQAEGLVCADPGARILLGVSGIDSNVVLNSSIKAKKSWVDHSQ